MNKKEESNKRVKKAITDALFSLLKTKNLNGITISELIKEAGVARMSFYRNYTSKEDVLLTLVRDVLQDFRETADYDLSNVYQKKHVYRSFRYFEQYSPYFRGFHDAGFSAMLLQELNRFHEEIAGLMSSGSKEKYRLYVYMGALYNTALQWRSTYPKEELSVVAEGFCESMGIREEGETQ